MDHRRQLVEQRPIGLPRAVAVEGHSAPQLKAACGGDLLRLRKVVKLVGFVNCSDDFIEHPKVINGVSDLMVAVFGEEGRHARAAVGAPSLPLNAAVEVDGVFELR